MAQWRRYLFEGDAIPLSDVTGHDKAAHDALGINAGQVDGYDAATLLARGNHTGTQSISTLSDHNKTNHDALDIDAGSLDGETPTTLRDRSTHTGTQAASTISDFDAAVLGVVGSGVEHVDSVLDKDIDAPPGSPATRDRYLIGGTPSGAWIGHAYEISEWTGSAWEFTVLSEGLTCWVDNEDARYTYNGTTWVKVETLTDLQAGAGLTKSGTTLSVNVGGGVKLSGDTVEADPANIPHDSLSGYDANEHLDWTMDQGVTDVHANNVPPLPTSILTDHNKANHDALGIDAATIAGDTPANIRDRSTHTGTQPHTTISDFDTGVRTNRLDQMALPTAPVGLNGQGLEDATLVRSGWEVVASLPATDLFVGRAVFLSSDAHPYCYV